MEEVEIEEAQSGDKDEYEKFFKGALKKFGVDSPAELKGDKEKEFYDYVDKNWKGADEQTEEIEMSKEDAAAFMTAASKAKAQGKKKFKMGGKEYPVTIKIKIPEEVEIDESMELQVKMALDDAGVKHRWKGDKLYVKRKDRRKALHALTKSFKKGGAPDIWFEEVEITEADKKYPPTIETLKMIVKDKQNQVVKFKDGNARVDGYSASAMTQVYDAMKKPDLKKNFEKMIETKAGFLKIQAFAFSMVK